MKYLVDSNVISEATKPAPAPDVVYWLRQNEPDLAVSPVVLGEIEYGILLLPSGNGGHDCSNGSRRACSGFVYWTLTERQPRSGPGSSPA